MFLELEMLIASFILFLMLFCAFEAFDRLSGGQIMKLENTEPELAEKLSGWMDRSDSIRGVFKLMLFILSSLMGMLSYSVLQEKFGNDLQTWRMLIIIAAIICSWYLGEIISRLVLYRYDTFILRTTLPFVSLLANTVLLPFTLLARRLRKNAFTTLFGNVPSLHRWPMPSLRKPPWRFLRTTARNSSRQAKS